MFHAGQSLRKGVIFTRYKVICEFDSSKSFSYIRIHKFLRVYYNFNYAHLRSTKQRPPCFFLPLSLSVQNAWFVANVFIPISETGNTATVYNFIRFHIITIRQVVSLVLFGILVFCALGKHLWNAKDFSHNQHFKVCNHSFFFRWRLLKFKKNSKTFWGYLIPDALPGW